jgi:hypothetical protein
VAADLVTIATTAALTQFVGPAFKHLGEQALERAKQVASKAADLLAAVGREPQPVEPKLLLPLVQAASLETDPVLSAHWAALLANAADPIQQIAVHPSYADILRQITPTEAKLLSELFTEVNEHAIPMTMGDATSDKKGRQKHYALQRVIHIDNLYYKQIEGKFQSVPEPEMRHSFDAIIDNVLRQSILVLGVTKASDKQPVGFNRTPDRTRGLFTSLGYDFMQAVTPPTP